MQTGLSTVESTRRVALSTFVSATFGFGWGVTGSAGLPAPFERFGLLVAVLITAAFFGFGVVLFRLARRSPTTARTDAQNPFRTRAYGVSVLLMAISIPFAGIVLSNTGFENAIISVVAIVVGLHFFGLVRAFDATVFAVIGGAMCLLGGLSLGLPVHVTLDAGGVVLLRQAVVGIGCALVLWGGQLGTTVAVWRGHGTR